MTITQIVTVLQLSKNKPVFPGLNGSSRREPLQVPLQSRR